MKRLYQCLICDSVYDDVATATACEAAGVDEPVAAVGQLVVTDSDTYGRFGWYDGDPDWVIKKPRGLHCREDWDDNYYSLVYVVTHIDHVGHRTRYHLETKAMRSQYRAGYTFNEGHWKPKVFSGSLDGSDLIGNTASGLVMGRA